MMKQALATVCVLAGLAAGYAAGETNAPPTPREANKRIVAAWHERDLALARGDANLFVRPGLVADRAARTVRVYGESVSLGAGDPVEFLLIAEDSGKDYESQAVSFARPSDVHRALAFAGFTPGTPVDASALRFWPRGERVRVSLALMATNGAATDFGRAERTIMDTRTGKPLPETGFTFCGGRWTAASGTDAPSTNPVFAADVYSPNAIVSVYNESQTVLDVPRRAAQGQVYTFQVPNPDHRLPAARLLQVTFAPEFADGKTRLADWTLHLESATNGLPLFTVKDGAGTPLFVRQPATVLSAAVKDAVAADRELHAVIAPEDNLEMGTLREACALIESLEDAAGLRVAPPLPGHPYYKAFLPDEKHRSRGNRPMQPFELNLTAAGTGATGTLTLATEEWKNGASEPVYHDTTWPVSSSRDLADPFSRKEAPAVLLVAAARTLTYGQLRPYAEIAVERRMILFVFANSDPAARTAKPHDTPAAP